MMTRDEIIKNYFALHGELPTAEEVDKLLEAHNQSEQPNETVAQQSEPKIDVVDIQSTQNKTEDALQTQIIEDAPKSAMQPVQTTPTVANNAVQEVQQTPKLTDTWITNGGLTFLGVLVVLFLMRGTFQISSVLCIVVLATYCVWCFIYVCIFIPSYFTTKPVIKSNNLISFLNGFSSAIISSGYWNSCLTKDKKPKGLRILYLIVISFLFMYACYLGYGVSQGGFLYGSNGMSQSEFISTERDSFVNSCSNDKDVAANFDSKSECESSMRNIFDKINVKCKSMLPTHLSSSDIELYNDENGPYGKCLTAGIEELLK